MRVRGDVGRLTGVGGGEERAMWNEEGVNR